MPPTPADAMSPMNVDEMFARLTPAEKRVAAYVRQGYSNKEIAQSLNKAPCTVKAQVATILHKFGVRSRSRLLALWLTSGSPQAQVG
ncbi:MAG: helix-turn-helix transcriptional regulator [Opitutaceae bacterium]|nr:helix-turn-helix transcriptional regulator [Opitutaceae bacterium]